MMYSGDFLSAMEELLESGFVFRLLLDIPSGLLGILSYIFTSLGLYTIAKRRGLRNPWLSWIPVANVWILGSLSDQYRYVVKGENKSKRKVLLVLNILSAAMGLALAITAVVLAGNVVNNVMRGMPEYALMEALLGPGLLVLGLALPLAGIGIAYAVIYYMALYDLYTSCDPGNSVLFLVLSILIGASKPFFLFFSRERDDGMPPRRRPQPAYIPQQNEVPPQSEPEI